MNGKTNFPSVQLLVIFPSVVTVKLGCENT